MNENFGDNFTVETLLGKIPLLIEKGKTAELKKGDKFVLTLSHTQV